MTVVTYKIHALEPHNGVGKKNHRQLSHNVSSKFRFFCQAEFTAVLDHMWPEAADGSHPIRRWIYTGDVGWSRANTLMWGTGENPGSGPPLLSFIYLSVCLEGVDIACKCV